MDKEWARLRLCLAERRNQLPTLRPTASSSQPDQRLRGQTKIYLFLPPLALLGWGVVRERGGKKGTLIQQRATRSMICLF